MRRASGHGRRHRRGHGRRHRRGLTPPTPASASCEVRRTIYCSLFVASMEAQLPNLVELCSYPYRVLRSTYVNSTAVYHVRIHCTVAAHFILSKRSSGSVARISRRQSVNCTRTLYTYRPFCHHGRASTAHARPTHTPMAFVRHEALTNIRGITVLRNGFNTLQSTSVTTSPAGTGPVRAHRCPPARDEWICASVTHRGRFLTLLALQPSDRVAHCRLPHSFACPIWKGPGWNGRQEACPLRAGNRAGRAHR